MKISELWLREFASPPGGTPDLVHQLTMQGLEVETVEAGGPALDGVVVGRVIDIGPHPNADRLRVCQVDIGTGTVQIVCGAANVRAGGLYPAALPGATLPGGMEIRGATLRGVESGGMLCSAAELGLAEKDAPARSEGLLELDPASRPGTAVSAVLGLPDNILDLKITPNRADCFSVVGVARDLAATTGLAFAEPAIPIVPAGDGGDFRSVSRTPPAARHSWFAWCVASVRRRRRPSGSVSDSAAVASGRSTRSSISRTLSCWSLGNRCMRTTSTVSMAGSSCVVLASRSHFSCSPVTKSGSTRIAS